MVEQPALGRRDRFLAWWRDLPANVRGAALMVAAALSFTTMAVVIKILGQRLDTAQIVFFRTAIGLLFLLPLIWRAGLASLRTTAPHLHGLRALTGVTAIYAGFYAFTHLPLAMATTLTFAKPLFTVLLAVVFLHEVVRWRRWTATVVGFLGVLVVLRPGFVAFDIAMVAAVGQALMIALSVVILKKLPRDEPQIVIMVTFSVATTLISILPAMLFWIPPTPFELLLAVAVGFFGVTGQYLIVWSYRTGEASAVAPFDYTRLVFATLFGALILSEMPDMFVFLGAGLIIGSAVYIARREAKKAVPPPPAPG